MGSGCGSVGRVVASDTNGPWFEPCHWQMFKHLFTVNCVLKRRKKKKEAGNAHFLKKTLGMGDLESTYPHYNCKVVL